MNKQETFKEIEMKIYELFKLLESGERQIVRNPYKDYSKKIQEIKGRLLWLIKEYKGIS